MTLDRFNHVIVDQLDFCKALLFHKGIEYDNDETDRLASFKAAGVLQDISPKEALCGMMAKHIVSVYEMCRSSDEFSMERWTEKITDSINYLLILKAMVIDETE